MTQGSLSFPVASKKGWQPAALPSLDGVDELGFDTETTGLRWWAGDRPVGFSLAWRRGPVIQRCYLPVGHRGGGNLDENRVREYLSRELRGKRLVGLNTKFDAHMTREWGVDLSEMGVTLGDVGHYAALLDDHRRFFNLESLCQDFLGVGKIKTNYATAKIADQHASMAEEYAEIDAVRVIELMDIFRPRILAEELTEVADLEDSVQWTVLEMEKNGCPIDMEKLERWIKLSEKELTVAHIKIAAKAGYRVNPKSPTDLARVFHDQKIETHELTESGALSYSDSVLKKAAKTNEVIALVRHAAHLENLRSKYLLPYRDGISDGGILRTSFHQLRGDQYGTVSGRFSSSKAISRGGKDEGANVQQVMSVDNSLKARCDACADSWGQHKDALAVHTAEGHPEAYIIRELFVPGSGILIAPDASQIEYRIFAHFTNSPAIIDVYNTNPDADFHATVGEMIHRFRPDFERKRVKNCNFAVLFGSGIDNFASMMGVSADEARTLRKQYDRAFPQARELFNLAMETAERRGYVKTILGRRTRFPDGKRLHKALNGAVQGSAADIMKRKMRELYDARKELGLTLRMTVHDEAVSDAPDEEAARRTQELLNKQSFDLRVPILWDMTYGANWKECK